MRKSTKAILAGLAFVAGCEIGIAIQLTRMIRDYVLKDEAQKEPVPVEEPEEEPVPVEEPEQEPVPEEEEQDLPPEKEDGEAPAI